MVDFKKLADSIFEFNDLLSNSISDCHIASVDMGTVFVDNVLALARNKIITALKSSLITNNGYMNIPALLLFCHSFGFKYANVHSMTNQSSFNIICGDTNIRVSA